MSAQEKMVGGKDALAADWGMLIDKHLDQVLRASGSALSNYSLEGTRMKMRAAMADAMLAAVGFAAAKRGTGGAQ